LIYKEPLPFYEKPLENEAKSVSNSNPLPKKSINQNTQLTQNLANKLAGIKIKGD
jgi:hypothetical protein